MERFLKVTVAFVCVWALFVAPTSGSIYTPIQSAPSGEVSLLGTGGIMDTLYGSDNFVRISDSLDNVWWNPNGTAAAQARFAGNVQRLYYENSVGTRTPLFDVTGSGYLSGTATDWVNLPKLSPPGEAFTWVLNSPSGSSTYWSSDAALNAGNDHMVTFKITGTEGDFNNTVGNYVIAWEDLPLASGDRDYNDLVVEVSGVKPIPEPVSLAIWSLLAVGGAAAAGARKRRGRWAKANREAILGIIEKK